MKSRLAVTTAALKLARAFTVRKYTLTPDYKATTVRVKKL
jgi:hypothetical protein